MKMVNEIYGRYVLSEVNGASVENQIEKNMKSVPKGKYKNCVVSEHCKSCKVSGLLVTKPISHNIAFSGREIEYIPDLTIGGDVAELTNILGVNPGNCISCEFPIPNPNTDRGQIDSLQPLQSFNQMKNTINSNSYPKRNDKSSAFWSANFETEKKMQRGKKLTALRKKCHQYIRASAHKKSFEKVIKPDFHPMINSASKRILSKYIESSKLADAHLLGHGYVIETQKQAYKHFENMKVELESKKGEEFEKIKQLTKTVTDLQIKLAEKNKQAAQGGPNQQKLKKNN